MTQRWGLHDHKRKTSKIMQDTVKSLFFCKLIYNENLEIIVAFM